MTARLCAFLAVLVACTSLHGSSGLAQQQHGQAGSRPLHSFPGKAWVIAAENDETVWAIHADTVQRTGGDATFWVLANLQRPFALGGKPVRSVRARWQIACWARTLTWIEHHYHSGLGGAGEVLGSERAHAPSSSSPISPGTVGAALQRFACR